MIVKDKPQALVTTIDLLRHGECEGGHRYRGSWDVALTETGWQQMQSATARIEPQWQTIISSPLVRCQQFARTLSEQQQLPLSIETNFRELHFGDWEGRLVDEVWQAQTDAVMAWGNDPISYPPPNGEAADVFVARVIEGFQHIVNSYQGQHILLISHGGTIRALLTHCLSMPVIAMNRFDVPYACVSRIQVVSEGEKCFYRLLGHNIV